MISARQEAMLRKVVAKLIETSVDLDNKGLYDLAAKQGIIEDEAEARKEFNDLLAELRIS